MKRLLTAALLLLPETALAHSGALNGSGFAAGFAHPFGGADHLLAMVAVGIWAAQSGGRGAWALPLGFLGAMAAGALLGGAGLALPLIEAGILASSIVIGLVLALALRPGLLWAVPVVAGFGLLHGQAHGLEAPATGLLGYGFGFVAATAGLHLAGFGLGRLPLARGLGAVTAFAGLALALA